MELSEFKIGDTFWTATGEWRCTDIGTRVVAAITLDKDDPSWYNGPPYAVAEFVFDENDMGGCYRTLAQSIVNLDEDGAQAVIDRVNEWQANGRVHPLTCGNDSGHAPLVPLDDGDDVVLVCRDCDYRQKDIPDIVVRRPPKPSA